MFFFLFGRFPQPLFTPLASLLAQRWKPPPERGTNKAPLSRVASTPLRCTAEADVQSRRARRSSSSCLPPCRFPQKKPPFRSLRLLLVPWDVASVARWPRTEVSGRRRSCHINTPTKAPPIAPSAVLPTDSSRVPPFTKRAGAEAAEPSPERETGGGHSGSSSSSMRPGPVMRSTKPHCTELPRSTVWGAWAKAWMSRMELLYTATTPWTGETGFSLHDLLCLEAAGFEAASLKHSCCSMMKSIG